MSANTIQPYPRTVKKSKWVEFLGRNLEPFEENLLCDVLFEIKFNKRMEKLYENCLKNNYFVPELTNLHGNCLFESLVFHGIGNSVMDLRKGLAYLMYQFRNHKGFLENNKDSTLKELYILYTDKDEYVYCRQDNKLYKYSYEIMCQDLATNCSWGNLHAELLLLIVSQIYNVQFEVTANEFDKITYRHAFENGEEMNHLPIIRLGHIFENHYVPIDTLQNQSDFVPLYYSEAKIKFHKWGSVMAQMKHESIMKKKYANKLNPMQKKKAEYIKKELEYSSDQFVDMSNS